MKKQSLLLILSLFTFFGLSAQEDLLAEKSNCSSITCALQKEYTPNYDEEMDLAVKKELNLFVEYLNEAIEYPELSRLYNIEGKMVIRIVFDGEIKDLKVVESLNPQCDKIVEEKIRKYAKDWDGASKYKNIPKLTIKIPIDFRMAGL